MDVQKWENTSSAFLDCVKAQSNSSLMNSTANTTMEVINITTCGNASIIPKLQPARQKEMDSVRILLYSLIFLLSVFGNLLIIVVLTVNKRMRTVTNSFLLSLAVSDLMMAIFCMPFTLIPNLLGDFIFGAAMCKIVAYFMGISVSISTFSLVAIAIERYSAICNPLKSRAWQTRSHAYRVITAIWIMSLLLMTPYPIFSVLVAFNKPNRATRHMCRLDWPVSWVEQSWYILLLSVLFFIPGVVMIIAYGLISRELYRGIQFELDQKKEASGLKNGMTTTQPSTTDDGDGCYVQVPRRPDAVEMSTLTPSGAARADRPRSNTSEAKLMAKKRVIRMLIVIVAMFFVCWMPLYSVNTWKAFDLQSAQRALSGAPISFIHLLCYTSACVNPVIYCFMNKRFRKALLATFAGCLRPCRRRRREPADEVTTATTGASLSKFSYTTVSTMGTS
ncbi:cholecystokinin receptor [Megalops cyprinoides]|uniref:cholecystokinin receptor n=1 Tax=Megalops cyprinoides TaxID=118141 RepID=UPI001864C536|nr:cholecystokinin receptor [Megalops cyprinoides]